MVTLPRGQMVMIWMINCLSGFSIGNSNCPTTAVAEICDASYNTAINDAENVWRRQCGRVVSTEGDSDCHSCCGSGAGVSGCFTAQGPLPRIQTDRALEVIRQLESTNLIVDAIRQAIEQASQIAQPTPAVAALLPTMITSAQMQLAIAQQQPSTATTNSPNHHGKRFWRNAVRGQGQCQYHRGITFLDSYHSVVPEDWCSS
uniref:Uncharacterized protein n=1 Tax=Romanomermis culicivorax TaxID=13658 RepID=A0A915K195_ROMCU